MACGLDPLGKACANLIQSLDSNVDTKRIQHATNKITGWWFGTMDLYDFPFSWECRNPN